MLLADMVVGMQLESLVEDWTFTTDFSFRRGTTFEGNVVHAEIWSFTTWKENVY